MSSDISALAATGIPGLDDILGGGLTRHRLYVVRGTPGSGKTTLALQFLLEGIARGETVLYITLSETEEELRATARSHGWSLDGVRIRELEPGPRMLGTETEYTMFHPSEVELAEAGKHIAADVDRWQPARVVIDSLSELRLLAGNALRYRRQILALKQFLSQRRTTVLVLDDRTTDDQELHVESIAHGVINLDRVVPDYGTERRRLSIVKYRGRAYRGGNHDFLIRTGGIEVYPRLVAAEHRTAAEHDAIPSGIPELDTVLGGGLDRGASTLVLGAAGTGKSTLAMQLACAAAAAGHRAAMFLFDESTSTLLRRAEGLGLPLAQHVESGRVTVQQIDPAELTPGQFVDVVRRAVEQERAAVVVVDSLNGYLNAMPEERHLVIQLHELLAYLGQRGVATLLVATQQGLVGQAMRTPIDATYLADVVVMMRYFEQRGELRQAISVLKRRGGAHERTIREYHVGRGGLVVGGPLRELHGVLTGIPVAPGSVGATPPPADATGGPKGGAGPAAASDWRPF